MNRWKVLDEFKFSFGWHQLVMPACRDVSIDKDDYRSSGHHQSHRNQLFSWCMLARLGKVGMGEGWRWESLSISLSLFLWVEILAISILPHSPLHVLSHIHNKREPLICSWWRASFSTVPLQLFWEQRLDKKSAIQMCVIVPCVIRKRKDFM